MEFEKNVRPEVITSSAKIASSILRSIFCGRLERKWQSLQYPEVRPLISKYFCADQNAVTNLFSQEARTISPASGFVTKVRTGQDFEHGSHHATCQQAPDVICAAAIKVAPVKSDVVELVWIDRLPDFQLLVGSESIGAFLALIPLRRAAFRNASFSPNKSPKKDFTLFIILACIYITI